MLKGRIQQAGYSLCLLERLQDALRSRDIWLKSSDRWGDPRQNFFRGGMAGAAVSSVPSIGSPTNSSKASVQLAAQLDETRKTVASRFDHNTAVNYLQ